jgi:5'-methylthioadenosine phosphorylase
MSEWAIGILGGSGLYALDALEDAQWIAVDTPWGAPSDELLVGRIEGVKFVFLPRHGRGHPIPPGAINARANVDALKRAGCTDLVAISAIGSLREELEPGRFVAVDQFIDRTFAREASFSVRASPPMSRSPTRSARACRASPPTPPAAGAQVTRGATYLAMEGRNSTRAESLLSRLGLRRDWHDREPGIQARPRGRAALRPDRHGHRL